MEREEFKVLVKGMKAVYAQPTFIPDQNAFDVWYELLKDLPYKQVNVAIQKYMVTERFPPTIADIRTKAIEVIEKPADEMSELEAWHITRKAIRNSGYHAQEEFDKLPEVCQIAVGNPDNLKEWALMDSDQVETVGQSHFIRNFRTAAKRITEDRKIPAHIRTLIEEMRAEHMAIAEKAPAPKIEEKPAGEEPEQWGMSEDTRRKLDELMGRT
jgi:hypothetical protein